MMEKGSTSRWGNSIGYVMIPLWMKSENDIFEYIRRSKTIMDRKKLSLEPLFSYTLFKLTVEVFGYKVSLYIILISLMFDILYVMVNSNGFIWTCGWITGTKNSCNENFWSLNSRIVKCCRSDRRNKPFRPPNILCCRKYIWFSTGMTQKANNISLIYFASLVILKWSKRKKNGC